MQAEPSTCRWIVGSRDSDDEQRLAAEVAVSPIVAAVLRGRGFGEAGEALTFLHPSLDQLHDPALLPDYVKGRDAILGAKERGETIFVHGDYDVDGITSAALFYRFLASVGCKVVAHVPHRIREGYGVSQAAIEEAAKIGARLFLTCDCGTSAIDQVKLANAAGMAVVVTDHHEIGKELPAAAAFINPHRTDSRYPFAELSGVGVAFRFCEGLARDLGHPVAGYRRAFLDFAALGTIADVMPLVGENRVIARFGLERLKETKKVGLRALLRTSGAAESSEKGLRAYHVGFVLGPRLNAAGRLDDAAMALQLLIENDEKRSMEIAVELETLNKARRDEQERIFQEAVEKARAVGADQKNVIVVSSENWHAGVIGIVAGKLVDLFRRPAFVASIDPETGMARGSARTIPAFHLANAIRAHEHLVSGGGHALAAGFSTEADRLDDLAQALDQYAGQLLTTEDFLPQVRVDAEVAVGEIDLRALEGLTQMEPFGIANPEPTFVARDVRFAQVLPTKVPTIVRLVIRGSAGDSVGGVMFQNGDRLAGWDVSQAADVVFHARLDEFRGNRQVKWTVQDYATSG